MALAREISLIYPESASGGSNGSNPKNMFDSTQVTQRRLDEEPSEHHTTTMNKKVSGLNAMHKRVEMLDRTRAGLDKASEKVEKVHEVLIDGIDLDIDLTKNTLTLLIPSSLALIVVNWKVAILGGVVCVIAINRLLSFRKKRKNLLNLWVKYLQKQANYLGEDSINLQEISKSIYDYTSLLIGLNQYTSSSAKKPAPQRNKK